MKDTATKQEKFTEIWAKINELDLFSEETVKEHQIKFLKILATECLPAFGKYTFQNEVLPMIVFMKIAGLDLEQEMFSTEDDSISIFNSHYHGAILCRRLFSVYTMVSSMMTVMMDLDEFEGSDMDDFGRVFTKSDFSKMFASEF